MKATVTVTLLVGLIFSIVGVIVYHNIVSTTILHPCIDKHGKEVPNGTVEDGRICTEISTWHEESKAPAPQEVCFDLFQRGEILYKKCTFRAEKDPAK